jgi:hypothetical protein
MALPLRLFLNHCYDIRHTQQKSVIAAFWRAKVDLRLAPVIVSVNSSVAPGGLPGAAHDVSNHGALGGCAAQSRLFVLLAAFIRFALSTSDEAKSPSAYQAASRRHSGKGSGNSSQSLVSTLPNFGSGSRHASSSLIRAALSMSGVPMKTIS